MKIYELQWKTQDGLDIFGQGWESTERKPKAVVCLVHGLGEHINRYQHVAEAFGKDGYAMVGADLRGHGKSGGIRGHTPSIEAFMQDIDLLLKQAHDRYPNLPIFLYGHSLGGLLVLTYGLRRDADLKGIIATGAGLRSPLQDQAFKVTMAKILGSLIPTVTIPSGLDATTISRDEKVVRAYLNDPLTHEKVSLGFGKIMIETSRQTLENAAQFKYPLLLMHGKADRLTYPKGSQEFAAATKARSTLMLWDNMYHELHNEPEQNEVLKTMTIWMDARL